MTYQASREITAEWESPVRGARWLRTWRIGEWLSEPLSPLSETLLIPLLATAREKGGLHHLDWKLPKGWHLKKPWYCVINGYFYARADLDMLSFALFLLRDPPRMKKALNRWNQVHLPAYLERLENFKKINLAAATNNQLLDYAEALCRDAGEWWYLMALDGGGAGFLEKMFRILYKTIENGKNRPDPIIFFRGNHSKILAGEQALYDLACKASQNSEVRQLFTTRNPAEVLEYLETNAEGKKFLKQLDSYLQIYGHQVSSLDLLYPTLIEEPTRLVPILKRYMAGEARKPAENLAGQAAQREEAVQTALEKLKNHPLRRRFFLSLVKRIRELAVRREDTVFYFQLGWPLIRKVLAELSQRLLKARLIEEVQDLFFLNKAELWEAVQGLETKPGPGTRYSKLARDRRENWEKQRQLSPPDRIPPAGHPLWQRKGPVYWGEAELHSGPEGAWFSGIGASPGQISGRARVLNSVADFQKLERGEILVTKALTPAWIPLFSIAAAAVAEAGGVTSHASGVAREYGIPVVVGTGIAGKVIKDGQVISVDGSKGIVYLR